MKHILKCPNGHYTMEAQCPQCSEPAISPKPPKYSPEDRYGKYRREAKKESREQEGLL